MYEILNIYNLQLANGYVKFISIKQIRIIITKHLKNIYFQEIYQKTHTQKIYQTAFHLIIAINEL